jgi:molybdenum cofactor cytidylyltransferase
VILAAGASSRLGEPKQLARLGRERLLDRAVRVAGKAGCGPIVVVLGAVAERIQAECGLAVCRVVINPAWADGMATSLGAGVAALDGSVEGAVVMTCDQPAVTAEHLQRLAAASAGSPVASSYAGRRGAPAYFPASWFTHLSGLRGDAGARELLASAPAVELSGGDLDVDTPEALATARSLYE